MNCGSQLELHHRAKWLNRFLLCASMAHGLGVNAESLPDCRMSDRKSSLQPMAQSQHRCLGTPSSRWQNAQVQPKNSEDDARVRPRPEA
eukprot:CAMPEP_0115827462 /NCGR_PEP_ID=MMETSP0287-20121206/57_1 /TAXON_ID=412157 /ORGANISM="Chrysochromulina rotalis, Strain UIO044" /LENGTH=88 /DNA_ID=CAMNT_0003280621 /DNA_START=152 /DNA_END=418 /DNA_ORIENTATION=+